MDLGDISVSKSKKKNKSKKKKVEEPEPVEDHVTKRKKDKKAMPSPSVSDTSKAADVKFGRKKAKQEMNNNMSPVKDLDQSFSSIDSSEATKIKKRKSTLNDSVHEDGNHSSEEDLSMMSVFQTPCKKRKVEGGLNTEENQRLLQVAMTQVKPEMITYVKRWTTLDFEAMSKEFDDKTPEDCEIQLKMLIETIVKKKCLHQILSETLNELPNEKTINNSFANFIHLSGEQIGEELNKGKLGQTRLTVASVMWKNMTQAEKKSFEPKKIKVTKMDGQTSFEVFYLHLKKKNPDTTNKDARLKWSELKWAKKIKYVKKSAKLMSGFLDIKDEDSKKIKGPTKDEIATYLEYVEAPKDLPKLVSVFYYLKQKKDQNTDTKNLLMDSIKAFNELSKSEQEEWAEKHKSALKKHERAVEKWQKSQDEITLFIYKLAMDSKSDKKKDKGLLSPSGKKLNLVEMPVSSTVKFNAEPTIPPLTLASFYAKEHHRNTGEKLSHKEAKERFAALDKKDKLCFKKKIEEIKTHFINGLMKYVGSLSNDQRRLFLGIKRLKFMRLLGEDIFEAEYPNEEYPIYSKESKTEKGKNKDEETPDYYNLEKQESEDANLEEVEEEEHEEEESDEGSVPSPTKLNKTRDYSARKETNPAASKQKKGNKKAAVQPKEESGDSEEESDDY